MAVPAWQPGLTIKEKYQIERVQRTALHITLGDSYSHCEYALNLLDLDTLEEIRIAVCENFAEKTLKHPKFSN